MFPQLLSNMGIFFVLILSLVNQLILSIQQITTHQKPIIIQKTKDNWNFRLLLVGSLVPTTPVVYSYTPRQ